MLVKPGRSGTVRGQGATGQIYKRSEACVLLCSNSGFLFRDTFRDAFVSCLSQIPYITWPVGGIFDSCLRTRISWPMAISRYLAPIEARFVRAFLFPFFPADLRVFDLMVSSFPLRGVRVFR